MQFCGLHRNNDSLDIDALNGEQFISVKQLILVFLERNIIKMLIDSNKHNISKLSITFFIPDSSLYS